MATTKVTFTLDEVAISRLQEAAARLALPKSEIVRKAILEFYERVGEREQLGMVRAFDELVPKIPARPVRDVDRELDELRKARRMGGRRTVW
jgi:Ribbon-helix-helix protein, copG family